MEQVIKIRALVCDDTVALQKWTTIVDYIVKSPSDRLRIKKLFNKDYEHEAAVLESLELWWGYGDQRSDLLKILQDHGLNELAGKIQAEGVLTEQASQSHKPKSQTGIWFEVGEGIYNFTGREAELNTLHEMLTSSHSTKSAAANIISICGLGGIGKSSLAREYAHRHMSEYAGNILWVNAETIDSMKASFLRLADRLRLVTSPQECDEEIGRKVYQVFPDQKSLFIFDNVEEKPHFRKFQPKIENPAKHTPYILVTTRRNDVASLPVNQLCLDVFTMDEAIKLIQKQILCASDTCAQKLAIALQMLPLALQQALAYINDRYTRDTECISKYLKEFEVSAQKLLADERFKDDSDYLFTTYATWALTLARIRTRESEGGGIAIRAIEALAYLNPDLITVQFVTNIFEKRQSAEIELGLKLLERFSMIVISAQGGKILIHRLVQKVIIMSLSSEQEVNALTPIIEAIAQQFDKREFTNPTRECMSHGLHLFPIQVKRAELMKEQSGYLSDLCYFLKGYGNSSDALFIAEQSSAAYESIVGKEHEDTLTMKWRTAIAHHCLKNYSRATEILQSVLPICQSKLEHWLTMNILSSMALVHNATGNYQKAISIYDEIIPVRSRLLGKNHENVLVAMQNKARALRALGKLGASLELLQIVYDKRVELRGKDDQRTLGVRESIDFVFHKNGELGKAIEIWTEVYEGRLWVFGETHPDVVLVKENIEVTKADLLRQSQTAVTPSTTKKSSPSTSRSGCRVQ